MVSKCGCKSRYKSTIPSRVNLANVGRIKATNPRLIKNAITIFSIFLYTEYESITLWKEEYEIFKQRLVYNHNITNQ